jgi:hypothetical protein
MGFVTLPCASAITCAWPPGAGRLERTGNPSLLEAMAYTLLAMSELGAHPSARDYTSAVRLFIQKRTFLASAQYPTSAFREQALGLRFAV